MKKYFFAIFAMAALTFGLSSCSSNDDNPASQPEQSQTAKPAELKQGIWTEFDLSLITSGELTQQDVDETILMQIDGQKAYFATYTAESMDDLVEGKLSYDNTKGTGSITFPTNPKLEALSGQTVNFQMVEDELLEFNIDYQGQQHAIRFTWLCKDTDSWYQQIDDEDWLALMEIYNSLSADRGPDASIDWSNSEVEGLAEPLVWNEGGAARTRNKAEETPVTPGGGGGGDAITYGIMFVASLFLPDPMEEINAKLDAVLGKLDDVLAGQQKIMKQIDQVNNRLIAIANQMKQTEAVNIFNYRNATYYNPLEVQNNKFYNSAYNLYTENKSNLSQEDKDKLGEYAKEWVGSGEAYADLTWQYIKYITTVQHSSYGTGMDKIYDGLTYDKYPWEHLGTGDRKTYRAYDMAMLSKCFFMINLYAAYGGLTDTQKEGLYNAYNSYKPQLKDFCEFKAANPDKYSVCQIPGAHFVMHKELQKYYYEGENKKAPVSQYYGCDGLYRPEWHEAGSIKIENPDELRSKLIRRTEAEAIRKYYGDVKWTSMLIDGDNAGGAVYAKNPTYNEPVLILYDHQVDKWNNGLLGYDGYVRPVMLNSSVQQMRMGFLSSISVHDGRWDTLAGYDSKKEYYMAIVEKHY